jgi:hypothetical protein
MMGLEIMHVRIYNVGGEIVLLITLEVFLLPANSRLHHKFYVIDAGIQYGLGTLLVVSILELGIDDGSRSYFFDPAADQMMDSCNNNTFLNITMLTNFAKII